MQILLIKHPINLTHRTTHLRKPK